MDTRGAIDPMILVLHLKTGTESLYLCANRDRASPSIISSTYVPSKAMPSILSPQNLDEKIFEIVDEQDNDQFLRFNLKENYLDFLDSHYLHLQGAAMSTKLAPPYASLFMAKIEQKLTYSRAKIPFWRRFIKHLLHLEGFVRIPHGFSTHSKCTPQLYQVHL